MFALKQIASIAKTPTNHLDWPTTVRINHNRNTEHRIDHCLFDELIIENQYEYIRNLLMNS